MLVRIKHGCDTLTPQTYSMQWLHESRSCSATFQHDIVKSVIILMNTDCQMLIYLLLYPLQNKYLPYEGKSDNETLCAPPSVQE